LSQTRDRIIHSPAYDPALEAAPTRQSWGPYYGYYGMWPNFGSGFMYPTFSPSREESIGDKHFDRTDLRHG
jgi:hypothetical protein